MPFVISASTQPAPLVSTLLTSHMITPSIFLNSRSAPRTILNILVVLSPLVEVTIHSCVTSDTAVPWLPTLEADFLSALANNLLFALLDEKCAVRSGTPSQIGIHIHINVFLKFQIFFEHSFWTKLLNIIPFILFFTPCIGAFDISDLAICNVVLEISSDTVNTKLMDTCR